MSDRFVGIDNHNEFYTEHYLDAILASDLKSVLEAWKDAPGDYPPAALRDAGRSFFRLAERMTEARGAERVALHVELAAHLLHALGTPCKPVWARVGRWGVPLLARICTEDVRDRCFWLLATPPADAEGDLLSQPLPALQRTMPGADARQTLVASELFHPPDTLTLEDLVTACFDGDPDQVPRFVVVLGPTEVVLAERAKWAEQRMLRFDLAEVLDRKDPDTLAVVAALLHLDSLVPSQGAPLLDTLDESSHKHAYAVSEDLKYALRECIELLGNAAVQQRKQQRKGVHGRGLADQLSRECLTWMYRLLFLFYIEARPELGYAPMGEDSYRLGYSLERLRELEQVHLRTDEDRNGSYLHRSLTRLFDLVWRGFTPKQRDQADLIGVTDRGPSHHHTFEMVPLKAHLFDPKRTPLLDELSIPNTVWRDIIERMSLSRPGSRHSNTFGRGRISYATLGINQLGAVYEALLSYRGFFAEQDLYEVKRAKDSWDPLGIGYFVTADALAEYEEEEIVTHAHDDPDGRFKKGGHVKHDKGRFIYRLAGRDRQRSASYYTPQSLTRCLVKYALKELLEDDKGNIKLTSQQILQLTVCEPAMGSAAFLNEAVDQLAEAYLRVAQQERGERIPHDRYVFEKQRVKMVLADNNVFGVDLNPVALELAEVSLWLNTIHEGGFVPWFGMQLACGNSLVGAWRKVYKKTSLDPGAKGDRTAWLDAVPERVPLGSPRPKGAVYHWLLGDQGMAVYGQGNEGRPIKELCADALAAIDAWRADFNAPLDDDDRDDLVRLSAAADKLWDAHVAMMQSARARTTDPLVVYGHTPADAGRKPTTTRQKDEIWNQEMASQGIKAASPYARLKLAMDYWCALWFWPMDQAHLLPGRDEFLLELTLLLEGGLAETVSGVEDQTGQRQLFPRTLPESQVRKLVEELGYVDVEVLCERVPRLQVVRGLQERMRFLHWELEFADLFAERGGFDLVVGNPPWIRVQWKEADALGDHDPMFGIRSLGATEAAERRGTTFQRLPVAVLGYRREHEQAAGTQAFLSAASNYPDLHGSKANLYKCFLPLAWSVGRKEGVMGLLHPEGVYDDPNGGALREAVCRRLRHHYQFINEHNLFAEVDHHTRYSINILGGPRATTAFVHVANLFAPSTIDECHEHLGAGPVPGLKDEANNWDTEGHAERIIRVGAPQLALFASLFDDAGTPALQARLPALHSRSYVEVLQRFAAHSNRLPDVGECLPHDMWNEARARNTGIIAYAGGAKTKTAHPASLGDWILSGPHFHVGNPLYKSPRDPCSSNLHYDVLDLCHVPDDSLPRTSYVPGLPPTEYRAATPKVPWAEDAPVTDFFRLVVNRGLNLTSERTLQPAIAPREVGHIHGVYSYTFADTRTMALTTATWMALPIDFFVKTTGAGDFFPSLARQLPVITDFAPNLLLARTLALNCLTTHYTDLWSELWDPAFRDDAWTSDEPRLDRAFWSDLTPTWQRSCSLRSALARRQALVELDVLVAMALKLSLHDLQTIYRAQFPVMRHYEGDTWYDQSGRIVFTNSRGLVGVGLPRTTRKSDPTPAWSDVQGMTSGTVEHTITDDTLPGGPVERTIVYRAPFTRCDREADYARAWAAFTDRLGAQR